MLASGLFVLAWMVVGVIGRLSPNTYLLAGIPLTLLFQRFVRRRPIWRAWIMAGPNAPLDAAGWACGLLLALPPLVLLWERVELRASLGFTASPPAVVGWLVAAAIGGLVAGHVVRGQSAAAWRRCAPYTATGIVCGLFIFTVARWPGGLLGHLAHPARAAATLFDSAVLYFDVSFIVEEVTFRGVLDPYLLGDARGQAAQFASALASSALWGLWHLPLLMTSGPVDMITVLRIVLTHASFGLILCFAVRAAGTLVTGAFVHALSDAYRNLIS
jgi:hypothetical protein